MPVKKVAKKKAPAKKASAKKTTAKALKCPRDKVKLDRIDKGRGAAGHYCCSACNGFWISGAAIKRENTTGLVKLPKGLLDDMSAYKIPAKALKCPEDGSKLCKVTAHDVKTGDVVIDACPSCRGIWFDQSEYGHVITKKGDVPAGPGFFNSVLVFLSSLDKR
ncbi:MAG: zf-TFIIB domain-containing protein [Alphaproteobacteria bacterium]